MGETKKRPAIDNATGLEVLRLMAEAPSMGERELRGAAVALAAVDEDLAEAPLEEVVRQACFFHSLCAAEDAAAKAAREVLDALGVDAKVTVEGKVM
ncbi:hypothetical protein [Parvibacter caecicola]|uniref:hypothetical protein n=1 Tax=Parvibacter caecicola TaxID=747645 RepID=UPI00272FE8EE|nr:hypothetical protein [Parvibacter caecicola]